MSVEGSPTSESCSELDVTNIASLEESGTTVFLEPPPVKSHPVFYLGDSLYTQEQYHKDEMRTLRGGFLRRRPKELAESYHHS